MGPISRSSTKRRTFGVSVKGLSKSFGSNRVLAEIDLTIHPGEFFTIIGPSGCGKTTLLRIISGFHQPDQGRICFDERDITYEPPWKRNIGFVFQNYALWPNMNVFDNVAYGLKIRKRPADEIRERVKWALNVVDLPGVERHRPDQLSGGMQQRVAIARAIVINPGLLLLDEPLSNLDAKLRISLRKQIREIQRELQITAIYVTHDQEEALEISDRIAILNKGYLQQVGEPEEVYENPSNRFVANFVGEANFVEGTLTPTGHFETQSIKVKATDAQPASKPMTMVVRPENIDFTTSDEYHAQGTLIQRDYLGRLKRFLVELPDQTTLYVESLRTEYSIGDTVRLRFNNVRLIPQEGEPASEGDDRSAM